MKGKELKELRERILMSRESLAVLLGVSAGQVKSWEKLGKTGVNATSLQMAVIEALAWSENCMDPEDALTFGRSVDAWRLSKGVGFAVYCLLRLQHGEDGVEVGCD